MTDPTPQQMMAAPSWRHTFNPSRVTLGDGTVFDLPHVGTVPGLKHWQALRRWAVIKGQIVPHQQRRKLLRDHGDKLRLVSVGRVPLLRHAQALVRHGQVMWLTRKFTADDQG